MPRRIFEIAKDLDITSKAIIDKCVAEGIPADKVKNHMASISPGLEASIREWFSAAASVATAVETTAHVGADQVKAKPRRRARSKSDPSDVPTDGGEHSAHEVEPKPEPEYDPDETSVPTPPEPVPAPRPSIITKPTIPVGSGAHEVAPTRAESLSGAPTPGRATESLRPAASAPEREGGHGGPGIATGAPPARPLPPRQPVRPAPMNVPVRPTSVSPAGPKLQVQAPVKLSGPKVVRIEAPEFQDPRPARRAPGYGSGPGRGPGGGAGPATAAPGGSDDRGAARRNTRRAPGGEAPAPAKRRTKPAEETGGGNVWREQDLLEREARLQRSGGYLKQRRRELRARSEHADRALSPADTGGRVPIQAPFSIKDLSATTGVKVADILKKLLIQGVMANANSGIDPERAQEIMLDFDIELEITTAKSAEEIVSSEFFERERKRSNEQARAPIVTIMGHVDHGKTSLLDKIRNTNVAAGEAGGITQKTSAFRVEVDIGGAKKPIVFLDTPGHQAFTEMRSRGANMTDVIVLVVSAPDGVMPQTIESISHARAAKVPIVVALNKIDSAQATDNQIQKIFGQLAEQNLNPVEWGGQTEVVRTSATKGTGIQQLLEVLDLQAQLLELKADFSGPARGRVIEATRSEGRGALATIMIQEGELKLGDAIVAGRAFGKVRDISDDRGNRLRSAGPAMPVQVSGIDEVPNAGDPFFVAESLRKAQDAAEQRRERDRMASLTQPKVTLDSLFSQMKDANVKEILIVLKADVQGSVDVIKHEIERLSTDEVKVRVLHAAVGGITESDVLLADASKAVIVGFNVIAAGKATGLADAKGVEVRTYQVIYDITEDVKKAATGMLEPEIRQEVLGHAEVRRVFKVTRVGTIAGCYITDGLVQRDALIRVTRGGIVIENDRVLDQLKRFKDDAKDVKAGMECGMKILGYDDIKEGDVLECYKKVEIKRTL
ncbi:MAG: translation initiation factor IF-2 [Phycisphaerae bacterium]|nr:translation initiation factor IF-2 [Phycisphaerae bacterium]